MYINKQQHAFKDSQAQDHTSREPQQTCGEPCNPCPAKPMLLGPVWLARCHHKTCSPLSHPSIHTSHHLTGCPVPASGWVPACPMCLQGHLWGWAQLLQHLLTATKECGGLSQVCASQQQADHNSRDDQLQWGKKDEACSSKPSVCGRSSRVQV